MLEETKPKIPIVCEKLNYLLFTPFRYQLDYGGSRFRRKGQVEGVWYGSEYEETALAEMAFYRFLFYAESPDTHFPENTCNFTAYAVGMSTDRSLDLTKNELSKYHQMWMNLNEYEDCQTLADNAREIGVELIRYYSVRDLERRANLAVLSCNEFTNGPINPPHTWRLKLEYDLISAVRESPYKEIKFERDDFSSDSRLD